MVAIIFSPTVPKLYQTSLKIQRERNFSLYAITLLREKFHSEEHRGTEKVTVTERDRERERETERERDRERVREDERNDIWIEKWRKSLVLIGYCSESRRDTTSFFHLMLLAFLRMIIVKMFKLK